MKEAELSSCIIQKFNRYDVLKTELKHYEKKNLLPLDTVYKPTQDKTKPIYCFFVLEIYLAFQSVYDKIQNDGKKSLLNAQQRNNAWIVITFFVQSEKGMQEHILYCADKITEKNEKLESIETLSKRGGFKLFSSKKLNFIEEQIEDSMDLRKNKMMIEFNDSECLSVKYFAVKSKTDIKCTE